MRARFASILAEKQKEVDRLKRSGLPHDEVSGLGPRRDFKKAVSRPGKVRLIAEIKFASPSAGLIREREDPANIARMYEASGAAAISVLTDETFFGGRLADLPATKAAVRLPVLRKDFLISAIQLHESARWGADAVLLIVRVLGREKLKRLLSVCGELGMAALTECRNEQDLETALACGARIIGINNRDLETLSVDLNTTRKLIRMVPEGCVAVSESGVGTRKDVERLGAWGVRAVLVGTALMKSRDMAETTRALAGGGPDPC